MPILSCRCVITICERGTETARRRTWIEAGDLRALVVAAAREIAPAPEACEYALFTPEIPRPGVFLEVLHDRASALVGPMGGPRPPTGCSSDRFYRFEEFLTHLGFEPDRAAWAHGRYLAMVKHAGIWDRAAETPVRGQHESAEAYRKRCDAIEHQRVERARQEGMHVLRYPVAVSRWRARDLERMMALAYRLLPKSEPRWRESGTIIREEGIREEGAGEGAGARETAARETAARATDARDATAPAPAPRYWLQVGRGEYVVSVALPRFPGRAVSEWLGSRRGEVALCHPVAQLERAAHQAQPVEILPPLAKVESVHVDSLM